MDTTRWKQINEYTWQSTMTEDELVARISVRPTALINAALNAALSRNVTSGKLALLKSDE